MTHVLLQKYTYWSQIHKFSSIQHLKTNFFQLKFSKIIQITWHMIGHTSTSSQSKICHTFHLTILLRIILKKLQMSFFSEETLSSMGVIVSQALRCCHHIGLDCNYNFLVERGPEILCSDSWDFSRMMQQDFEALDWTATDVV